MIFLKRRIVVKTPVNIFCILFQLVVPCLWAQTEIPIGTWRRHLSFNRIHSLAATSDGIFAASTTGVVLFQNENGSFTSSVFSNLSDSGITDIAYDNSTEQLIVVYENGNIDIIDEQSATNFPAFKNLTTINGSRRINDVSINGNYAYLSSDFGVVVFDLTQREVKETWRDLGENGESLQIYKSAFLNDSIFLATANGILAGKMTDNLLDFSNWRHLNSGDLAGEVKHIATFNNTIYTAKSSIGLMVYESGQFSSMNLLAGVTFNSIATSPEKLIITTSGGVHLLDVSNNITNIADDDITEPLASIADALNTIWIGDAENGIISIATGENYVPNGPGFEKAFRLSFSDGRIIAVPGGFSSTTEPLGIKGKYSVYQDGAWKNYSVATTDVTDAEIVGENIFLSSFKDGLLEVLDDQVVATHNETNSTLQKVQLSVEGVFTTDIEKSLSGLWVTSYGSSTSIHRYNGGSWQSYSTNFAAGSYPLHIALDDFDNVWMAIDPKVGGGLVVLKTATGESIRLTTAVESGALPNENVRAIANDRDGNVWVGTDEGVVYFYSADQLAVRPIYDDRFLLKDEKITAIAIDGGNRKWIGTEKGVWLFNETGDRLFHNFTSANSPLLADHINDIAINHESGEVFFATTKGIVSFRGDATINQANFSTIKIFPNPVTKNFQGELAISQIVNDAIVKITDVSGNLIQQIYANGGTATWNLLDRSGKRVGTGIYLVFAASEDGKQKIAGKIVVID
jgi:ligand-binding sensor domain-containing protein